MLRKLLQDPTIISAVLSVILGAIIGYLVSLRQRTNERKEQRKLRYLNDLNKTYASFVVAINELDICAKTGKCDSKAIEDQRREATLALAQIQQTAPAVIFNVANTCWGLVGLLVNNDKRYPRDFLSTALFAHLVDFTRLKKAHLEEDEVELPDQESAVFRLNAQLDEWMKAPLGKDYKDPFMDWVNSLPAPDESDPQL